MSNCIKTNKNDIRGYSQTILEITSTLKAPKRGPKIININPDTGSSYITYDIHMCLFLKQFTMNFFIHLIT